MSRHAGPHNLGCFGTAAAAARQHRPLIRRPSPTISHHGLTRRINGNHQARRRILRAFGSWIATRPHDPQIVAKGDATRRRPCVPPRATVLSRPPWTCRRARGRTPPWPRWVKQAPTRSALRSGFWPLALTTSITTWIDELSGRNGRGAADAVFSVSAPPQHPTAHGSSAAVLAASVNFSSRRPAGLGPPRSLPASACTCGTTATWSERQHLDHRAPLRSLSSRDATGGGHWHRAHDHISSAGPRRGRGPRLLDSNRHYLKYTRSTNNWPTGFFAVPSPKGAP